jgi:hypothetical protein
VSATPAADWWPSSAPAPLFGAGAAGAAADFAPSAAGGALDSTRWLG